ncbi:MAG: FAD-dependent oxidoreductase [Burkholderiaceae bacterium]|nr:FAD-dependent oxidoreductase [Burkholderiaceae bacterium]
MSVDGVDRKNVSVIGAGIIGASIALVLQREGHRVTLIDSDAPGTGCSFGNGGAISPDFCVPFSLPGMLRKVPGWLFDPQGPLVLRWRHLPSALPWLMRSIRAGQLERVQAVSVALHQLHSPSLRCYDQLLGGRATGIIEKTGQIYAWTSSVPGPTEALAHELRAARGVQTEVLSRTRLHELDPQLSPSFSRGLYFPDNGHTVNPLRLVQTIVGLFEAAGGCVERCRALEIERTVTAAGEQARSVRCEGKTVSSDAVVVAAGIQSTGFARALSDRVPLQAERGYHVMLPDAGIRPKIKISNRDRMFGVTPMEDGLRICGTVEIAAPDSPPDERRALALLDHAKAMYPGLNDTGATTWMGSRPSTPDSLPIIDRASRVTNVIYAFGHGHTGLTGAPMTAQLVRDLLADSGSARSPGIDSAAFRLERFARFP